jgi:hypothetical protein
MVTAVGASNFTNNMVIIEAGVRKLWFPTGEMESSGVLLQHYRTHHDFALLHSPAAASAAIRNASLFRQ